MKLQDFKGYCGSENIRAGGMFVNVHDWKNGYCHVLKLTPLHGTIDGLTLEGLLVQPIVAIVDNPKRTKEALERTGFKRGDCKGMSSNERRRMVAYAIARYGYTDTYYNRKQTVFFKFSKESCNFEGEDVHNVTLDDYDYSNEAILHWLLDNGYLYYHK